MYIWWQSEIVHCKSTLSATSFLEHDLNKMRIKHKIYPRFHRSAVAITNIPILWDVFTQHIYIYSDYVQFLWNFKQRMAILWPCSLQNVKMIVWIRNKFVAIEVSWAFSLRGFSEGYLNGSVQETHNSIANAMELRLSCTSLLISILCNNRPQISVTSGTISWPQCPTIANMTSTLATAGRQPFTHHGS